jgi:hypothetical protein
MLRRSLSEALLVLLFLLAILAAVVATSADAAPAERETTRDRGAVTPTLAASSQHSNDGEESQRDLEKLHD